MLVLESNARSISSLSAAVKEGKFPVSTVAKIAQMELFPRQEGCNACFTYEFGSEGLPDPVLENHDVAIMIGAFVHQKA